MSLKSAGTLSPTDTSMMSPGTMSTAFTFCTPSLSDLTTLPVSGSYSFNASIADSAFLSCQTPTQALAIKMSKMTKGSTKAVIESSSSKKAKTYNKVISVLFSHLFSTLTNEMIAASNKILTRRSSNCSSTSSHRLLPSSAGNSGKYFKIIF